VLCPAAPSNQQREEEEEEEEALLWRVLPLPMHHGDDGGDEGRTGMLVLFHVGSGLCLTGAGAGGTGHTLALTLDGCERGEGASIGIRA
jgi:hypothetical protein